MRWLFRLRSLLMQRELDAVLDEELRAHLEMLVDEYMRAGLTPAEARRRARLRLGGVEQVKEECRDARGARWVDTTRQDVRFALRSLVRQKAFTLAALCTLALGIGANAAVFSVSYAVLLRPLPYRDPGQLVSVSCVIPQLRARFPTIPVRAVDVLEFRRSATTLAELSALVPADFVLTDGGEPERLPGARVSANLFGMLGTPPERGRSFVAQEDEPGRNQVVIISHDLWTRRFASDPSLVGRTIRFGDQPRVVVGIMPAGFLFPAGRQLHPAVPFGPRVDVWEPIAFSSEELKQENWNYAVMARTKPGVPVWQAEQDLNRVSQAITKQIHREYPGIDFDMHARVVPVRRMFSGGVDKPLLILAGAVGLLLLIACVNLANLLLARGASRSRELATRAALGAARGRLVRQLLTETLVTALLGGALGLLVAYWSTKLLVSLAPADLPVLQWTRIDAVVLLFTAALTLLTGIAFGLLPALATARRDLHEHLKDAGRLTGGVAAGRLRRVLVSVEVALCTGLLVVAGLLLHSFVNVINVQTGFAVERILSLDLSVAGSGRSSRQIAAFFRDLVEHVRAVHGVTAAGAASRLPLREETDTRTVYYETDHNPNLDRPIAAFRAVTPGYFTTMTVPLMAGRFFEDREPARAVIVSAMLARKLWPRDPLSAVVGRRVRYGGFDAPVTTIIGVVGDVRGAALDREPAPTIYCPHAEYAASRMTLVVRTAGEAAPLAAALRARVRALDPRLPVPAVTTMREIIAASVAARRFLMLLVVLFAGVSLALAIVGIYGVTSHTVARQVQEIGLRMALGAEQSAVLRSVLDDGLRPVLVGLALGLVAGRGAASVVGSFLFGVQPTDPVALLGVCVVLLLAATAAIYVPARRATRIDPISALRCE